MSALPGKRLSDSPSSRVDDMVELGVAGKALAIVELLVGRDYPCPDVRNC
jgi:hypothetical protein